MSKVKCAICKESFDKKDMQEMFTGRMQYLCRSCYAKGDKELFVKRQEFRDSAKGRQIIENARKKK